MIWERRADMLSSLGAAFVIGWASHASYYNVSALWQKQNQLVHVETVDLPKVQTQLKQANCDKTRLVGVAAQGIAAAQNDAVPAPDWNDLHGCPTVAPVKAPSVAAIIKK